METQGNVVAQEAASNNHDAEIRPRPVKKKRGFRRVPAILAAAAIVVTIGWLLRGRGVTPASAGGPPPPAAISVQTVTPQKLRLWNDFSGRLRAVAAAEIRPEVGGRIVEVRFRDGQSVKAGNVLVVIEPRPFEAAVARAEARVASAKAALKFAAAEQARNSALLRTRAIAQREFDQTDSADASAEAELLSAQADLDTAEVDLDHAYVKAPISGRVSRAELTVGNLVQSGAGAPLLTSIVSEDGIYADFEVDEQTYLETIRDTASGNAQEGQIPIELVVPGDTGRVYKTFVQNFDNQLDAGSGTIRVRARLDNADHSLLPGMFVSVRLASSREMNLMLVPDRAIGFDQSKKFVFVVSASNKVEYREVELGGELVGRRIVSRGLEAGDRVVVDGTQRVRPDAVVNPIEVAPQPETAAADGGIRTAQAGVAAESKTQ